MIKYVTEKHKGQKRIGGDDYITHPIAVKDILALQGFTGEILTVALFHDLLEDTDATEQEIVKLSSKQVLEAVKLLTKYPGYSMEEYISGIRGNELALYVKLADRVHNLRCAVVANKKFRDGYIKETKEWYIPLSKGTVFQELMDEALEGLMNEKA